MEEDGSFFLKNLGKRSIFLNGKEVSRGQLLRLNTGSLIEVNGFPSFGAVMPTISWSSLMPFKFTSFLCVINSCKLDSLLYVILQQNRICHCILS